MLFFTNRFGIRLEHTQFKADCDSTFDWVTLNPDPPPYGLVNGYFVAASGNVTDEVIAQYIEQQDAEPRDDPDFKISE